MGACEKSNTEAIDVLLNAEADSNVTDVMGVTWIHHAVHGGCSKETLQAIIDHGADVNATNKNNETALMGACGKGNTDAIDVLLNAGADSNVTNVAGATWIHYAVIGGCSKETLHAIIDHGADTNATNKYNVTALMGACEKSNTEAIDVLLNAGADGSVTDVMDATWIHYAVHGGCSKETLQAIIDHSAEVNATNKTNVTALMLACGKSNTDAIDVLLNAEADSTVTDFMDATWIHYAVLGDCTSKEILQAIIDHGADANATNKENVTALMAACLETNTDTIDVLLNAGADSTVRDLMRATWIHQAVHRDSSSKETLQVYN